MSRDKLLPLAAYAGLFFVSFFMFCYWTFPYDRVAAYLIDQVASSGRGYTLEIGELSPYWLSGVELSDVTLRKPLATAAAPADKKAPPPAGIKIPELRARLALWSLPTSTRRINFDAELNGGELEGTVARGEDSQHIEARLNKVDLGKLGIMETLVSLPVQGALNGDIDLAVDKDPKKTLGSVKLTLSNVVIGDGKAKLKVGSMGGLTVDPIEAGNVTIDLDVKNGVGTVRKMSADGKDLELNGSGDVRFSEQLGRSRVSVVMSIKFSDSYRNKSPRTKAMFSLLDSGMPEVQAAKTTDGALQFRLIGTLSNMHALPHGNARGGMGSVSTPPPAMEPTREEDE